MIEIKRLQETDIGRWVIYKTEFENQRGRIKSWNDKWIFVVYHCAGEWDRYQDYTAAATKPEDLMWSEQEGD